MAAGPFVDVPGVDPSAFAEVGRWYVTHLRTLLTGVVVAADRLQQEWADADAPTRRRLWAELGKATQRAEDEVNPL